MFFFLRLPYSRDFFISPSVSGNLWTDVGSGFLRAEPHRGEARREEYPCTHSTHDNLSLLTIQVSQEIVSQFISSWVPIYNLVGPYQFSAAQWNLRLWSRYVSEKSSLLAECGSCPTSSRQLSRWQEMQLRLVTAAYQGIATLLNTRQRALAKVRSSLRTCSQRYV